MGYLFAKGRMNVPMRIGLVTGVLSIEELEEVVSRIVA